MPGRMRYPSSLNFRRSSSVSRYWSASGVTGSAAEGLAGVRETDRDRLQRRPLAGVLLDERVLDVEFPARGHDAGKVERPGPDLGPRLLRGQHAVLEVDDAQPLLAHLA